MDPDAKIQIATMGTKLEVKTSSEGNYVRLYGLASTPDFGGEPNTIDSTTLDNTEYETNVLGLQPSNVLSYEFNMMALIKQTDKEGNEVQHNLTYIKNIVDNKTNAHWKLTKASGVTFEYDAIAKLQFNADEQSAIEKFTMFHSLKSRITVTVPAVANS